MQRSDLADVEAVYDASFRTLVGQLYAVCGSLAEAEDVVQEAFARAVQHHRRFAETRNPEAWLRTVAVNLSRSRFRRRLRGARLHGADTAPRVVEGLSPDHVALVEALKKLPRDQREAVALFHLADLTLEDVAEAVEAPVNTVKSRLRRGRDALALLLSDREGVDHA